MCHVRTGPFKMNAIMHREAPRKNNSESHVRKLYKRSDLSHRSQDDRDNLLFGTGVRYEKCCVTCTIRNGD